MSEGSGRGWLSRPLHGVLLLLAIAVGVRITWALLEPLVPVLVSLAVVLGVLSVAVSWRRL